MPPSALTQIGIMQNSINNIKDSLDSHMRLEEIRNEKDEKWKTDLLKRLEDNYAGKWVEKILIFVGTGIGIAIIGAGMALILKS